MLQGNFLDFFLHTDNIDTLPLGRTEPSSERLVVMASKAIVSISFSFITLFTGFLLFRHTFLFGCFLLPSLNCRPYCPGFITDTHVRSAVV